MIEQNIPDTPVYFGPSGPLEDEVLIPALRVASAVDYAVGYFNSAALRSIAPGLADFISNTSGAVRMIMGPQLQPEDYASIQLGRVTAIEVLERKLIELFGSPEVTASALASHTRDCLSYLIATDRLKLRLAWLNNGGIFHPKIWILTSESGSITVSGSQNLTGAGLERNAEQLRVDRSWGDPSESRSVQMFKVQFETWWSDADQNTRTADASLGLLSRLVEFSPSLRPTPEDYRASTRAMQTEQPPVVQDLETRPQRLNIPKELDLHNGDFAHQGEAIAAWETSGRRGILEMATGSGKTITALAAASFIQDQSPLMIVVAVPTLPLVSQWIDQCRDFGVEPIDTVSLSGPERRIDSVLSGIRRLRYQASQVEVAIVTHDFLCSRDFQQVVSDSAITKMIIADEVHHLGRALFIGSDPEVFDYSLGLSATPIRAWDQDGNDFLETYFGPVIFTFTLEDAIGNCLVPYEYYIHTAILSMDEEVQWDSLTERIRSMGWMADSNEGDGLPDQLQIMLQQRRKLIEQAESKYEALNTIFERPGTQQLHHTLIYASDKGREQLDRINQMLADRRIRFHQLTYQETGDRRGTIETLRLFATGELQALTAMRVLDEGVDIPQVHQAIIVASNTGERQWVQRRGRVLRKSDATGKVKATIHDIVVLRNTAQRGFGAGMSGFADRSEFERVNEFASLAENAGAVDGPVNTLARILTGAY
jgi:superfamily II DNA or RNA helicase